MYQVRVTPEIAKLRANEGGTRRRAGITFSRTPQTFHRVPKEVLADPHLLVEEVAQHEQPEPSGKDTKTQNGEAGEGDGEQNAMGDGAGEAGGETSETGGQSSDVAPGGVETPEAEPPKKRGRR